MSLHPSYSTSHGSIHITNDPFTEYLLHISTLGDTGDSQSVAEAYVCYKEDGDICVVKEGLKQ